MTKVLMIFDYLKDTFEINRRNRTLYKPQIVLAVLKSAAVLLLGIFVYFFYNGMLNNHSSFDSPNIMVIVVIMVLIALLLAIFWLVSVLFQAGLYFMYYRAVAQGSTQTKDFWQGVRRFFLKFLAIDLLTFAAWIPFLFLYLIVGFLTLGVGFAIIPILLTVFLGLWKISIVSDNCGVFDALKNGFRFGAKFFIPYTLFVIISLAFTNPVHTNGTMNFANGLSNISENKDRETDWNEFSPEKYLPEYEYGPDSKADLFKHVSSFDSDFFDSDDILNPDKELPYHYSEQFEDPFKFNLEKENRLVDTLKSHLDMVGIVLLIGTMVLSVGVLLNTLIKMVFSVFFQLAAFVIYMNKFEKPVCEQACEVE